MGENVSLPLELNQLSSFQKSLQGARIAGHCGSVGSLEYLPRKTLRRRQQRVALVRALVHDPLLILADEPTGNLDEETGAQMMDLMVRLARAQNGTLLMVTHSAEAALWRIEYFSFRMVNWSRSSNMLSLRTLLRNPIQFAIMILGIALGVAVMVGIDLANASAARAFDLSASAITGKATHTIVAGDQGVDKSLYVQLRTDPKWRNAFESAPLVVAHALSPQLGDVAFTLLGIDPFAETPFRGYLGMGQQTTAEVHRILIDGSRICFAFCSNRRTLRTSSPVLRQMWTNHASWDSRSMVRGAMSI